MNDNTMTVLELKNHPKTFFFSITILLILLFLFPTGWPSDSLESELKTVTSLTERLTILKKLTLKYKQEKPVQTLEYGKEALRLLEKSPENKIKINILNDLSWAYMELGNYQNALDYGKQAETLARQENEPIGTAVALITISNIYFQLSALEQALDYSLAALKVYESLKYLRGIAASKNSIGLIYRQLKDYPKALVFLSQSLDIYKTLKQDNDAGAEMAIALVINNIALVYEDLNDYKTAMVYYSGQLKKMEELGSDFGIATLLTNIAWIYTKTGNYKQALENDRKAHALYQKVDNKRNANRLLGYIGRDYMNLQDYPKALEYTQEALKTAEEMKTIDVVKELSLQMASIFESMNDFQGAYHHYKKFKAVSDDILDAEKTKQIANLQVVYDLDKKERENRLLKKNYRIQKTFLVLVSILVLIIAITIYNRFRIRKKAERVLRDSEQKLRTMNAAKDKLFTIIAHDLGNPLNSLFLSATHLENHFHHLPEQEIKEFIHNIFQQTHDMSNLLENLLQWALAQVGKREKNPERLNFNILLQETLDQIRFSAEKKNITISSQIAHQTWVWADRHMVKTILRNLISNAVKYSFSGGIVDIHHRENGDFIEITISDKGIGMNQDRIERLFSLEGNKSIRGTDDEKGTGLGLVICKEFIEKNGGHISVESQLNQGSNFHFTLPKA